MKIRILGSVFQFDHRMANLTLSNQVGQGILLEVVLVCGVERKKKPLQDFGRGSKQIGVLGLRGRFALNRFLILFSQPRTEE